MPDINVTDLIAALQHVQNRGQGAGYRDVSNFNPPLGSQYPMYGYGLFGFCGTGDIVSALVEDSAFMRWLLWSPNNMRERWVKALTYVGPEGTAAQDVSNGWLPDNCTRPNSVEWGKCEIYFTKGLLGRCGQPVAAVDIDYKLCEAELMYRLDGTVINNDAEWQLALAGQVLEQDASELLVVGNRTTTNQFDGLEQIVMNNYIDQRLSVRCSQIDSIVHDWGNASISGIAALIEAIVLEIKQRSRSLGGVNATRDMAIVLPQFLRNCLVNEMACSGPCTGAQYNENVNVVRDARGDRDRYMTGGPYGDGWIPVFGEPIGFVVNDWIPWESCPGGDAGSYVSDIYVLTRRVGPRTVLRGEYQNFGPSAAALAKAFGADRFRVTDGGRFLTYSNNDETCFNTCLLTRPGLFTNAPFVQARIQNVCCTTQRTPISPDPDSQYFLDYGELYPALPPDYYGTGVIDPPS